MTADDEREPYTGPGHETKRRQDLPDGHRDAEEFVAEVDDVADEHLSERVEETLDDQPATPPPPPDPAAQ